ncbi:MAG: hypothetical protein KF819_33650 [Labilithrix sp.]|nr:hypothetical protein [Labilithrix sp.]
MTGLHAAGPRTRAPKGAFSKRHPTKRARSDARASREKPWVRGGAPPSASGAPASGKSARAKHVGGHEIPSGIIWTLPRPMTRTVMSAPNVVAEGSPAAPGGSSPSDEHAAGTAPSAVARTQITTRLARGFTCGSSRSKGVYHHLMSRPAELVVTAVGPDRPGIASDFTGHVHAAGANLADSRMVNLRGHFALLSLVEGTPEALEKLKGRLREAGPKIGMSFEFSAAPKADLRQGVPFRLKTYSMDQPGIVHKVTTFLREQGINVEELETRLESAPFMGTPVFTMEILMLVPSATNVKTLRRSLEELGDTINCDVDLDPA